MTNEEAREQLKHMKMFIGYDAENPIVKEMQSALDLAIKALEQQSSYNSVKSELKPCEDCISRVDALKAIEEQKKGFYGVERYAIDECHSAVMKLPSVRTSQSDDTTSQCDNDVTTCDTEKEKETNTEKDSDLNSDSEIHEDKRACEKCIHYVTRDSKGVVLCGCDSWECDFEEVKT